MANRFVKKKFGDGRRLHKNTPVKLDYTYHQSVEKLWVGRVVEYKPIEDSRIDNKFEEILWGENKVIAGGLQCIMEWFYGIPFQTDMITFEDDLYSHAAEDFRGQLTQTGTSRVIKWINICYDSSIGADTDPYPRYKLGYTRDTLIPFRRIRKSVNNYELYMKTYALPVPYTHPDGTEYIDYYCKRITPTGSLQADDGSPVPDNPNDNYTSDKDIRAVVQVPLNITDEEMVEYFRTEKEGGAESAAFNRTLLMAAYEAKLNVSGKQYDSVIGCYVMAACPHRSIAHGVSGKSNLHYKIMHI